jgi:hypothetical protein
MWVLAPERQMLLGAERARPRWRHRALALRARAVSAERLTKPTVIGRP